MRKLVEGVGIYEPGKFVSVVPGTKKHTREYQTWRDMLKRCYTAGSKNYEGYGVVGEWRYFQVFAQWLEDNNFSALHRLDKDIFGVGKQWYGPDTCCLVPVRINSLIVGGHADTLHGRGVYKRVTSSGRVLYVARCKDENGTRKFIGSFDTEAEAIEAYGSFKVQVVAKVADAAVVAGEITWDVYEAMLDWRP